MSGKSLPKYKKFDVDLPSGSTLTLYAGSKVLSALAEVTMHMNLYKGVRLAEVLKAVYEQGMKDGRREVIEKIDVIKKETKYLPPGRPRK
jgi:hypothetical protein